MGESKIMVTGATGDIGGRLVPLLAERGEAVRALCRRPDQVAAFRARGIDAVLGDLGKPETLVAAMKGCDTLFLLTAVAAEQAVFGRNGVEAALAAGITRVVHLSTSDATVDSPMPWASACARTDALLRRSGLDWTSLKPSAFMQNVFQSAPLIRRGLFPQTSGKGAVGWIDVEDIARVAARVLTESGHEGKEYVLTGPEPLTASDLAQRLESVLGHRVRYVHVPGPLFYLALRAGGAEHWRARGLVAQFADVVRHGRDGVREMTDHVHGLTGTPPRSFLDFAQEHRERFMTR